MISETPCSASNANATGISSLTGQRINPPGSDEYSPTWIELTSEGQLYQAMISTVGSRKRIEQTISIHACTRAGKRDESTSMRTCSLRLKVYPATRRNTAELR